VPIPHELAVEFPQAFEFIQAIEQDDHSFCGVTGAYQQINRRIYRIESLIEPASNEVLDELKRRRELLRQEIATFVATKSAVA
jgi:uncharacterized protein YdcH (DUF465 family)